MYAYIGIGSNLGNRLENINKAIELLRKNHGIKIKKVSSIIETKPVGGPTQENFLNGVIKIKTDLEPMSLLLILQNIEKKLGRVRMIKNGPRSIDLDILLYDNQKINAPGLKIPHPRMLEREFVMKPLLEIESDILSKI